jgi:sugar (Glycoside-Pentoside-Hexuronide) transporter
VENAPPFGLKDKVGYALGDFGCNMSFALISSFMYLFYTQYIGIPIAAWSVVILIVKIWDAIDDPIMGGLMDSVKLKGGKFKPWIKIGSIGLFVAGALVFLPVPNAPAGLKIFVCIASYLVWDFFYSLVNVPYGAFNAAITPDSHGKAMLSTFRSVGASVGGMVSVLLPIFVFNDDNELLGGRLFWIALVMGVFALLSFYGFLKLTNERVEVPVGEQKFNYLRILKDFGKNRAALGITAASLFRGIFFTTAITMPIVFQSYFHQAKLLAAANIVTGTLATALLPFMGKIVRRFGKKAASGVPLIFSAVTALVMIFVPMPPGAGWGPWVYIAGMTLIQFGGGVFGFVCWAMVSDAVDYQYLKTGRRDEGSIYAIYSLFRKVSQGVSASLIPVILVWAGYEQSRGVNQLPTAAENIKDVSFIIIVIGAVLAAVSLLFLYNLGKKEELEISAKINSYRKTG